MGKTKATILEEKLKEKEIAHYSENIDVDKLKALTDLIDVCEYKKEPNGEIEIDSPFNQKGKDIIVGKIIEVVKRM